ncbi:hypothetical protein DM02DRAFT_669812 [Periconia macrospinosa]|uniref:F-box domain-containing protein n=1 Tax=Periconia macrospinosa TaxID=97972 RepID=A0A2V1DYL9_9PLEO|nr:hypothetical protein DM02DRAFT_669812 [Periconia macrospinosa]
MAHSHTYSPLSVSLPNSRMSVDFATFTTSLPSINTQIRAEKQLPPHPAISRRAVHYSTQVQEIPAKKNQRRRWAIRPSAQEHPHPATNSHISELSRANSNASAASAASAASTASAYSTNPPSVFSYSRSTSTVQTAHSSQSSLRHTLEQGNSKREPTNLTSLPSYLLEHILSYALCLPLNVSIGPPSSDKQHKQYRYHRAGVDYIDLQLIRKHPVFLVSRHVRDAALHALHDKCTFIIDLHSIYRSRSSSTVHDNFKKHKNFWLENRPPRMVRDTLRTLSRLSLRLPAASCEDNAYSARKADIDEQEGGNQRIRSLKKEKDYAARIETYLESILSLIWADKDGEEELRGRSPGLGRRGSFRRRSISRFRSKSRERLSRSQELSRSTTPDPFRLEMDEDGEKRQPLRRLEVVLVKRNPHVVVLPETLLLVKLLRTSKVQGLTKYFLELEGQKTIFATKYGKRWRGIEPDGIRLLNDLQSLSVSYRPIEPFTSSREIQLARVASIGNLPRRDVNVSESRMAIGRSRSISTHINPLNWGKRLKRKDSFQLDDGQDELATTREPPSVDELKKIAEDIKNGLY